MTMSAIYADPIAMDATAGAIGEHAREVEGAVASLQTACSAQVPPAFTGWLAEELHEIETTVRLAALVYVVAALDTAVRAQQFQANQSLVTAWPPLGAPQTAPTTSYELGLVLAGSTVVGGTGPAFVNDFPGLGPTVVGGFFLGATSPNGVSMPGLSSAAFAAQNPFMGAAILGGGTSVFGAGPWGAGPLDFAGAANNHAIANILAPDGLDAVSPGIYEDERGRQGSLSQTYRNPRTGDLEF
jgi:hypothetical protein